MLRRQLFSRTVGVTAGAAAILLSMPGSASAAGAASPKEKSACMTAYTAYKSALDREKAGHLREARDLLLTCSDTATCAGLAPKCRAKYAQLGVDMPSIVPIVADESGTPRVDVEVRMDGQLLASKLDGKGIAVETGLHELTFSADGKVFDTEKVMVVEGQRNRTVSVTMHAPGAIARASTPPPTATRTSAEANPGAGKATDTPTPDEASPDKGDEAPAAALTPTVESTRWGMPHSAVPYVLATVGVAAVASGALLTLWGKKDNDQLATDCGQTQSGQQSSLDHIRTLYVAADISIGAGVVALGVATWMFASSRTTEEKPAPRAAYHVDVQPTRTGAFASVSGSF